MAGEFAKAINAKNLIITHFGAAYGTDPKFIENVMVPSAQAAFGSPNVYAAYDFSQVEIPRETKKQTAKQEPQTQKQPEKEKPKKSNLIRVVLDLLKNK